MLELLAQAPLVAQTTHLCQTNLPCRFLQDEDIAVGELNELNEELGSTKGCVALCRVDGAEEAVGGASSRRRRLSIEAPS